MMRISRLKKTISRVSVEKTEHEKLNDERGVKPLPVKGQQRRSRIGKDCTGRIDPRFCIRGIEISVWWHTGNYAGTGVSDIPVSSDEKRPTNVTAVAKIQTNRARSVASGVVSGVGLSADDSNAAL